MASIEELKQLINVFPVKLSESNLDKLFSLMEEVHYKQNDFVVETGAVDSNLYIGKEGVFRGFIADVDKDKETTIYFGTDGDIVTSLHSFHQNKPSVIAIEACSDLVMMKISKEAIHDLTSQSIEFSNWALNVAIDQLFFLERKRAIITGDAYERYLNLIENRPEIFQQVSLRIIASYLGITQQSLSRLRNPKYKKTRKE